MVLAKKEAKTEWIKSILPIFVSVVILYAVFRFALFYIIGWHDGLNLDWYNVYYPALHHADPYLVTGYFNPPWLVWILFPLGFLTAVDSHTLWIVLILLLTVRCVYELGGGWLSVVLTVLSPGFLISAMNGQIDVLILLGLLSGSWLLILIKPQVAGMAIVYDVIVKRRVDLAAVCIVIFSAIVFILFMSIPKAAGLTTQISISPWPWGIPFGVTLFAISIYRRDKWLAALSTFFFTPYLSGGSLLVYSAIMTTKYGRLISVLFAVLLWVICLGWFV